MPGKIILFVLVVMNKCCKGRESMGKFGWQISKNIFLFVRIFVFFLLSAGLFLNLRQIS